MPKGVLHTRNDISPSSGMMVHSGTQEKLAALKGDNFRDRQGTFPREITPLKAQFPFLHTLRAVAAAGECHEIVTGLCTVTIPEHAILAIVSSQSSSPRDRCVLCTEGIAMPGTPHRSPSHLVPAICHLQGAGVCPSQQAAGYSSTTQAPLQLHSP